MKLFVHGRGWTEGTLSRPDELSAGVWRRMSRLGRLALQACLQARGDASYAEDCALVVGTGLADMAETLSFLDSAHERGLALARPQAFQRSVHSGVAGEVAIALGLTAYNLTVTDGLSSASSALRSAHTLLASGRCSQALVVVADGLAQPVAVRAGRSDAQDAAAAVWLSLDETAGPELRWSPAAATASGAHSAEALRPQDTP